jgi:hypothetical protein
MIDMNIRISKEDVQYFGREETAVALPDGSGYIGTLNIYHEIHCIVGNPIYRLVSTYLLKLSDGYINICTKRFTGQNLTTFRGKKIGSTVVSLGLDSSKSDFGKAHHIRLTSLNRTLS